jgi:hypothetical protein
MKSISILVGTRGTGSRYLWPGILVAVLGLGVTTVVQADPEEEEFTDEFPIDACNGFAHKTPQAQNRYFILEVGRELHLSNAACVAEGDCDELEEVRIKVLNETEMVDGRLNRVVEESERVDGVRHEVSRNFFVECIGTEDVYYSGEHVDNYDETGTNILNHDGSWRAGIDGAEPGIIMPGGAFQLGARYYQEVAPGIAEDRAEHVEMGLTVTVPAGTFGDCVLIEDSNPLDDPKGKEVDEKVYCDGVGIVRDEDMELQLIVP